MYLKNGRQINPLMIALVVGLVVIVAVWGKLSYDVRRQRSAAITQLEIAKAAQREQAAAEQAALHAAQAAQQQRLRAESIAAQRQADDETRIQAMVKNTLKDPDSAKFGKLIVIDAENACLPVNARNSFGGYVGERYVALAKSQQGEWVINEKASPGDFADGLCRLKMLGKR